MFFQLKKKEREEILQDLMLEEQREAIEERYRQDMEKQIRQRLETRQSLALQLKEKEERLRQEAAEDTKYKEQVFYLNNYPLVYLLYISVN